MLGFVFHIYNSEWTTRKENVIRKTRTVNSGVCVQSCNAKLIVGYSIFTMFKGTHSIHLSSPNLQIPGFPLMICGSWVVLCITWYCMAFHPTMNGMVDKGPNSERDLEQQRKVLFKRIPGVSFIFNDFHQHCLTELWFRSISRARGEQAQNLMFAQRRRVPSLTY